MAPMEQPARRRVIVGAFAGVAGGVALLLLIYVGGWALSELFA